MNEREIICFCLKLLSIFFSLFSGFFFSSPYLKHVYFELRVYAARLYCSVSKTVKERKNKNENKNVNEEEKFTLYTTKPSCVPYDAYVKFHMLKVCITKLHTVSILSFLYFCYSYLSFFLTFRRIMGGMKTD